jgi:hypothetical protein
MLTNDLINIELILVPKGDVGDKGTRGEDVSNGINGKDGIAGADSGQM